MGMLCTGLWGVGGYQAAVAEKGWWLLAGGKIPCSSLGLKKKSYSNELR